MGAADKLPLAKESLGILVKNLRENDTVSLVTYAGSTRVVLEPTPAPEREAILAAIDSLSSGGGTSMGSGMELAYANAVKMLRPGEISRVIVLSDGDANIGTTTHAEILASIRRHVEEGVTLSTIGFGQGNYRDDMMEQLADKGNGNAFYVDSPKQARRIFEEQLTGTLEVVAKDMKLQVDFNPEAVARYRLVGYENRDIADKDFRNARVDAGEVGSGHSGPALYELELTGRQQSRVAVVRTRAKAPNGERAQEAEVPLTREHTYSDFEDAPKSVHLAVAAAGFADVLRAGSDVSFEELSSVAAYCNDFSDEAEELVELIGRGRQATSNPPPRYVAEPL